MKPHQPNILDDDDNDLLSELIGNYDFDSDAFAEIREQGSIDIKYIANDPWPDKEKQNRKENDRPMISIDQLNQYTNLVINEVRENPREVKISPAGYGATAKLAEFRENRVRAIQYKGDAQATYITAFENCVQRGYGFGGIGLRYVSETSFEQEIFFRRFPNPDAILYDTNCKELDCSDAQHCFVLDQISKKKFRADWPDAQIIDFSGDLQRDYPQWIQDKYIQIAEYWRVEKKRDTLIQFDGMNAGMLTELESKLKQQGAIFDQEGNQVIFPAAQGAPEIRSKVLNLRKTEVPQVMQYITNGIEILESNKWLGKWIPIVPVYGKELYLTEAGGSKRVLMSLIRNARDAQLAYNYFKTCETEAVGMVPKTNYLAYEGQFEGHEQEVADANKNPKAFIYAKATLDGLPQGTVLPLPIRIPFDPPIQNLEVGAESFSRSIQSTIGMYNSSVGKHDTNAKSGRAIQELDAQSDKGAFHFLDSYNRYVTGMGRRINDIESKISVREAEKAIRKQDGSEGMVRVNTAEPYEQDGEQHHYPMELGEYDITISVGPNADSQRDEATDFLNTFLTTLPNLELEPAKKEALLAMAIKLKQLGPIADEMVDILQPPPDDPAQLAQQAAQMQAQLQEMQQAMQQLIMEKEAKVLDNQQKMEVEKLKASTELMMGQLDKEVKIAVAEINTKAQVASERLAWEQSVWEKTHGAAHEVAKATLDQRHEAVMGERGHEQAKELNERQHQQAQDLAAQSASQQESLAKTTAELAPKPANQ